MPNDDLINALAQTYAGMKSAGDLRNKLAGDPSIPPPTPYENVMEQARGLHSNLTHADPVEMAMGLLGPRIPFPARLSNPIRAYHGSPHDFDKFDLSKIGTGEGAQAYGHGLYFAESEPVARFYREALSQKPSVHGQPLLNQKYDIANSTGHPYLDETIKQSFGDIPLTKTILEANLKSGPSSDLPFWQDVWKKRVADSRSALDALAELEKSGAIGQVSPGKMYEVALHATPEQFLDWDKPFMGQQPKIKDTLEHVYQRARDESGYPIPLSQSDKARGEDYLTSLANAVAHEPGKVKFGYAPENAAKASDLLNEAGIPGIKYLDQGSRGAGQGTSNYVVWSPEIIQILRKYGLMGPAALGAASAALPPDKAPQQ